jgi:hypothetical protein
MNNVRQVGLGMHNYENTHSTLPVGAYGCCWGTWQVQMLPYIEKEALWLLYIHNNKYGVPTDLYRYSHAPNFPVTKQLIPMLTCPSDFVVPASQRNGITFHNYAANWGNTVFNQVSFNGVVFGGAPFNSSGSATVSAQAFRFRDLKDGLSNTFLVGEIVKGHGTLDLRGFTWWQGGCAFTGYQGPNSALPDVMIQPANQCDDVRPNPPCTRNAITAANPSMMAARSRHPGGVQMTMGDGSGRFISDNVGLGVWRALCSSRAGDTVPDDALAR